MTDDTTNKPPQTADTTTPPAKTPKPPSLRKGSPKEIAIAACNRKRPYYVEGFASYLRSLEYAQQSIYQKKRPRQETLDQQMDILDAMFTYLSIHADWKDEGSTLSYAAALRAQRQFCTTLRDVHKLKFPNPAPKESPKSPPVVHQ